MGSSNNGTSRPEAEPPLPGGGQATGLEAQRNALVELSALVASAGVSAADPRFTELAARTLDVQRSSIWLLADGGEVIRCVDLYDRAADNHSSGATLNRERAPHYFDALPAMEVISAPDARSDPRTAEFRDGYLVPLGITSMLDAPIRSGGRVVGVLCNEHVGPPRSFRPDEEAFAVAVANLISLQLAEIERRAAAADAQLRISALEAVANAIVITDLKGCIVWVNPAFTSVTGYSREDAVGRTPGPLLRSGQHDDAFYAHLWRTIMSGNVWRGTVSNRRRDGSLYTEEMAITPVHVGGKEITHFVAVKTDITERQQLEERLLQSQKLETVGRLAGGVAHDFNNLLAVINGTADLAATDLPADHPLQVELREIRSAGERAALLTAQLLTFSRKQIARTEPLDLTAVVNDMMGLLRRLIGEQIRMVVETGREPAMVRADRGQMNQVIMNLVVNARDAIVKEGTIRIDVCNCTADGAPAHAGAELAEAPFVRLAISDDGVGMTEEVRSHLFEPFFTTKGTEGTGLGLSTVYGIVHQHRGTIDVASERDRGTVVSVLLPRIADTAPSSRPPERAVLVRPSTGRILVAEDEVGVRALVSRILRLAGYDVVAAADGGEALALVRAAEQPFDLLITDVVMPNLGGRDLVEHAMACMPGMRVLFMSGYADDEHLRLDASGGDREFLAKPFTVDALARRVAAILETS